MASTWRKTGLSVVALVAVVVAACGGKHQSSLPAHDGAGKDSGLGGSPSGERGGAPSIAGALNMAGAITASGRAPASVGGGDASGGGEAAGAGGAAEPELPLDPYAPRSGSFKMLVYSRTVAFRHSDSIQRGQELLQAIAGEQSFEVVLTESNELITRQGLAQFEIVFFLNTSGDVFGSEEEQAFEGWMTARHGAFAGVHSATDTENGWSFYSEVTGQFYDGHGPQNTVDNIVFEADALNHPALQGLPNPWQRAEEWKKFNSYQIWQQKPGFQILGRKAADAQPIIWTRQWGNFRSFYSGLGHDKLAFEDASFKQHLTGGIMWAVRREHLIP